MTQLNIAYYKLRLTLSQRLHQVPAIWAIALSSLVVYGAIVFVAPILKWVEGGIFSTQPLLEQSMLSGFASIFLGLVLLMVFGSFMSYVFQKIKTHTKLNRTAKEKLVSKVQEQLSQLEKKQISAQLSVAPAHTVSVNSLGSHKKINKI